MFKTTSKSKTDEGEDEEVPIITKAPVVKSPAEQAIIDLEQTMGQDWYEALKDEFTKPYFRSIRNYLIAEVRKKSVIYPATENIYSWSRLTPLDKVKVIVVGQDPYHGPNQAHGLSFSVLNPTRPPPSLINIYKELKASIPGFVVPKSGDLTALAEEGVLWLNTSLTVRASQAASHSKIGWETFTRAAMQAVLSRPNHKGVVFLAWGSHAQKAIAGFDKNKVLTAVHPSPLSASKGFFGCNHFRLANEWLAEHHGQEEQIDWTVICPK
ncbi:uracil-DNA glycosylase [Serendipita vermifera]|nr:uracil-DNA glycosylase [Serendipita vermifera]